MSIRNPPTSTEPPIEPTTRSATDVPADARSAVARAQRTFDVGCPFRLRKLVDERNEVMVDSGPSRST